MNSQTCIYSFKLKSQNKSFKTALFFELNEKLKTVKTKIMMIIKVAWVYLEYTSLKNEHQ